jgi:hypothetical protein
MQKTKFYCDKCGEKMQSQFLTTTIEFADGDRIWRAAIKWTAASPVDAQHGVFERADVCHACLTALVKKMMEEGHEILEDGFVRVCPFVP